MIRLIDILLEDTLSERSTLGKVKDFLTGRRQRSNPDITPTRPAGDVWQTSGGKFGAKNRYSETRYFRTREAAEKYSKGPERKNDTKKTENPLANRRQSAARKRFTTRPKT